MSTEAPQAPAEPQFMSQEDNQIAVTNLGNALDKMAARTLKQPEPKSEPQKVDPPKPEATEVKPETKVDPVKPEPEAADVPPPNLSDKEKVAWSRYRKIEKEYEAIKPQIEELQRQIKEKDGSLAELESARKELADLKKYQEETEGELYLTRVQSTKKYREAVSEPFRAIKEGVEKFAKDNSFDSNKLLGLMLSGDENGLEEFASDLSNWKQNKLMTWFSDVQQIEARKADIESNSKRAFEVAQEQERKTWEEQSANVQKARQEAMSAIAPKLEKGLNELLPEDQRFDMARLSREVAEFDAWPEDFKVFSAYAGSMLPKIAERNKALESELSQLKEEMTKMRNGGAKAGGGAPPTPQQSEVKTDPAKQDYKSFIRGLATRTSQVAQAQFGGR